MSSISSDQWSRITDMYETMLYEISRDMHENYAQLLAGALTLHDRESVNTLVSYVIDEMRGQSRGIYPLTMSPKEIIPLFKPYNQWVERRYGVQISYRSEGLGQKVEPTAFRLYQLVLRLLIEYSASERMTVQITKEYWRFKVDGGFVEQIRPEEQELLDALKKSTNMVMDTEKKDQQMIWYFFEEDKAYDANRHRG
ncbi:hypothetical protein EQV77_07150 [Halobacillus fulvus]|nr:hypothetical protein EQV77_07150 [Halobacillus fulvus]